VRFLVKNFVSDNRNYGLAVAWYNLRFLIGTGIASALIRSPMLFHVHEECGADNCLVSEAVDAT
jgi:hypothetical protein